MEFTIYTLNDNGSGMEYYAKEEFLKEISLMIDDCVANGGTYFSINVDADASCFYIEKKETNPEIENCEYRDVTNTAYDEIYKRDMYYCNWCECYMSKEECLVDCPLYCD